MSSTRRIIPVMRGKERCLATSRVVSPGYFDLLNLKLMRGRMLDQQDASGSTHAVVVNEHIAQRLWPNQDPLGNT